MPDYNPDTHVAISHSHVRGFIIGAFALVVAVGGVMYWYGGRADIENGRLVFTAPNFDPLKDKVVIKTADGSVVAKVQQPASAQPDGEKISDGIGPDDQLQRTVTKRYSIVNELNTKIAETQTAVASVAQSVKVMSDSVKDLSGNVKDLAASVKDVTVQVKSQGETMVEVVSRVAKLESAQANPAPAQPAAQPQPQPVVPPATSQAVPPVQPVEPVAPAAPAVGPQVSVPAAPQATAQVGIVTPDNASEAQLREMYMTGKALGQGKGSKIRGFKELKKGEGFECPNGNTPVMTAEHYIEHKGWARSWDCSGKSRS